MILRGGRVPRGSIDHLEFLVACEREAGYDVRLNTETMAIEGSGLNTQALMDAYLAAAEVCRERAVTSGLVGPVTPPDEEELTLWYRAYTEITVPCMVENGWPVSEPPSLESYIQSGGLGWHPYDLVGNTIPVESTCPQDIVVLLIELGRRDSDG